MVASALFLLPLLALGVVAGPHGHDHERLHRRATSTTVSSKTTTSSKTSSTTLKTSTKPKASSSSTTTISTTTGVNAARAAPTLTCPASNSTIFAGINGLKFLVQCGLDHIGGDIAMVYTSSLDACITTCSNTTNCQAVSWVAPAPGPCYMKSAINVPKLNNNVWGAMLTFGTAKSGTTSSSASSSVSSRSTTVSSSVSSSVLSSSSAVKSSSSVVSSSSVSTATGKLAFAPQPTNAKGPGKLPVTLASTNYLGAQKAYYKDGTVVGAARDLGYSGAIDGHIIWTFGDTLVHNPDGTYTFDSYDSAGLGNMSDPTSITFMSQLNYGNNGPANFIGPTANEIAATNTQWSEGGTNVVQTGPGVGFVYYQQNNRTTGSTGIQGCGVADVHLAADGTSTTTRTEDWIFSKNELCWGQDGAAYNAADGYLYVYTAGPNYSSYIARVLPANAHVASAYSAWNAGTSSWVSGTNRFTSAGLTVPGFPNAVPVDDSWAMQGVGWGGMSQSVPFWSAYYNVWMWVHGTVWGYSNIFVMTAPNPWGPWTDTGINVDTSGVCPNGDCSAGYRYAHVGHPEYDPSGKTILASWCWVNVIWLVQLTFV